MEKTETKGKIIRMDVYLTKTELLSFHFTEEQEIR